MASVGEIETLTPSFAETINPVASLGFIGLATDRASFRDFADFISPFDGVCAHATRIPFVAKATPESLAALGGHIKAGADVLVPGYPLDSVSFSCTSGTVAIGVDTVRRDIQSVRPGCPVATPIEAAAEALLGLGCKKISILVPYLMETTELITTYFVNEGFTLDKVATFDQDGDPEMNRIDPECLFDAAIKICSPESDALFISCTGLRTFPLIDRLEAELERPVVTSNQALAWRALRTAGVTRQVNGQGRLFSTL